MNHAANANALPPVVRVFLSSTFADMENERSYFNAVLVPKLNRICAQRGVSFFSVDLRWGITEEDQVNGQVLPICLGEIDKCRPFFIGILGNRYGSVMETVPPNIVGSIPWLVGKEGRSITELEMLYAVLDREKSERAKNCSFYFRTDALSEQWYGETAQDPRLTALKERIRSDTAVPSAQYGDLETFGQAVMADIQRWLDQEFPEPEKVNEVRRSWYDRELLRNYIEVPQMHRFLDSYIQETSRPLMIYGDGARGKTTLLTAWKPAVGKKILINCGSDDLYLYWPSIARQIVDEINEIDSRCGSPNMKTGASVMLRLVQTFHDKKSDGASQRLNSDFYFVSDEEREDFRNAFLRWLEGLPLQEPVYIVINDLNLLEDESSRFLSWLPSGAAGAVRLICSTNDNEMVSSAETLGWNCKEMPGFPRDMARDFVEGYLHAYGKNLSAEQMGTLLNAPVTAFPGQLRFAADFLIECGRFQNLSALISGLAQQKDPQSVYRYVYDFAVAQLNDRERQAAGTVFALLRCARMSLNEPECFRMAQVLTGITAMEWARIRGIFEQFGLIKGDYWNLRENELRKFVDGTVPDKTMKAVHQVLGDDMLRQLHSVDQSLGRLRIIRESTAYAKAVLFHYRECENWEKLRSALMDREVLFYLSKLDWQAVRVAWMALFLYSDTDIPGSLMELLERYRGQKGDGGEIGLRVAGLFYDLEQRSYLDRVYELMGTDQIPGGFDTGWSGLSDGFIELYNSMHDLKAGDRFRELYSLVCRAMSSGEERSPMEKCLLLFFKTDCEGHLERYEEFLKSANQYYEAALRAASVYDMRRALSLRGDALYRLGRYSEAADVQRQVGSLALREGDLRSYLAARNILAMCLYREKKFDGSVAECDSLFAYWMKLGNLREASGVLTNKCNALHLSGDHRVALETARAYLEQLPAGDKALSGVRCSLLANMGVYAQEMGDKDAAERYLLKSIEDAQTNGQEATVIRSRFALINLYKQSDQFMKAVELYKKQMDLLWERREYRLLTDALQDAVKLLLGHKYARLARELQDEWEKRFSQLEGGRAFFDKQVKAEAADSQRIDRLEQKLALSRSEGDPEKIALAYCELAQAVMGENRDRAVEYLLDAAGNYRAGGQESRYGDCLRDALVLLFDKGVIQNKPLYSKTLGMVTDPKVRRILRLWEKIGASQTEKPAVEERKYAFLDRLLGRTQPEKPAGDISEMLDEIVSYCGAHEELVLRCLMDVAEPMVVRCSAGQLTQIGQAMPTKSKNVLLYRLESVMLKDLEKDITELSKDYRSPMAEEKLGYYEKCVQVLEVLQSNNIAAAAGNLGIIFRRREEQDKALRCHRLSMELYKKNGKTRDYLIELMNMATCYERFGQLDQAVALLRQGMAEAAAAGERGMEAAMAGNLAAFRSRAKDGAAHEEVLQCFSIEERCFRDIGSHRDLAISLLNQVKYLMDSGSREDWLPKLEEAGRIIRENRFQEFEKVLARLEWMANQGQPAAPSMDEAQAARNLQLLLDTDGTYRIDSLKLEDGTYHAVCMPKNESKTEAELLHLFLDPGAGNQVNAIFLCQPRMVHKQAADEVEKFVNWWNEQGQYRLILRKPELILQANCAVRAANWSEVIRRFSSYRKLWQADKSCLSMMCIGMFDLPLYQGLKLKLLNEDQ